MDKIYILDAINYLFRSYYAIGPMTNPKGESTSALYGFIRSVNKLIKEFNPKHLVCVFDGPDNKQKRKEIYEDYKANRVAGPEDFYHQIHWALQFCKLANIPVLMVEGYEADDSMATVAMWAKENNVTSYLCTSDKDLFQLVDENTFVLNVHKDNLLFDKSKVHEKFGVDPDQILDLLALMGDASDNIPGVEGIGPKTAAILLNKYKTLENILSSTDEIGGKKGQTLSDQKDRALLSKRLATLHTDVPFPKDESFFKLQKPDIEKLKEFYQEMRFLTLLKELDTEEVVETKSDETSISYTLINSEDKLEKLITYLEKFSQITIDTETTFDHPLLAKLVGIGLCAEVGKAYYIPFNGNIHSEHIKKALSLLLENENISFIGQNIKFDLHVLRQHGLKVKKLCFDTMIASYLINPQNRKHNLDQLSLEYFEKKKIPITSLVGETKKKLSMEDVPLEKICEYCCEDVDYTLRLKKLFEKKLKEKNLENIFYQIELPLIPVLQRIERKGIYLDSDKLRQMSKALVQELQLLEEEIHKEVGMTFNIKSPKQLSEVLYTHLGLTPSKKKGSSGSTAAEALEELAEQAPIVDKILEYRGLEKLRSTYTDTLIEQVNPNTHRIHCTFNQSVAATGRLSCQDPNLQNIPIRSDRGKKIREGFKPQNPDWVFMSFDYSQIELRLLAHFSNDPNLVCAFQQGQDIHAHTASLVFKIPIEEVTAKMRYQAKTVNFGILYGQSSFGLSQQLGITKKEAKAFIETYFEQYKDVETFFKSCVSQAQNEGFVSTIMGRTRPIPEINNRNILIKNAAERLAINTPLQGSNADIIKTAMIHIEEEIQKNHYKGYCILQIHDELLFEVPQNEVEVFKQFVKEKMEKVIKLKVPLIVDIAVGKNWGEC